MSTLTQERCEACRADAPKVTDEQLASLIELIPGWTVENRDQIMQLEKVFKFSNYQEAAVFTNSIAQLADEEGHHPAVLLEWGQVTVTWWSHKIRGLHRNDFIMSARTDALLT